MRIGHGYDAHRFIEGKTLVIGGAVIDYPLGLLAHSDGDVLTHAIMDALLGAAGLGNIGMLFPDNDNKYKNISSVMLLEEVALRLHEAGLEIEYIDCTIIAEQPKLKDYIEKMREVLALKAKIKKEQINIKATTEEKMGFTGRLEGISAHAVCLLK